MIALTPRKAYLWLLPRKRQGRQKPIEGLELANWWILAFRCGLESRAFAQEGDSWIGANRWIVWGSAKKPMTVLEALWTSQPTKDKHTLEHMRCPD